MSHQLFQRHFTFRDEPWSTAVACALFLSAALMPLLIPHRIVTSWAPVWFSLSFPFLMVIGGIALLRRLRAIDSIRAIIVVGLMAAIFFAMWGGVIAVTGYAIARGILHSVPRLTSLNYFYIAVVITPIVVAAVFQYQKRLREIDGPRDI
jgi:hypothetical protein